MGPLLTLCVAFHFIIPVAGLIPSDCRHSTMDLVFVVDSSGSVHPDDYELMKQFLVNVVDGMVVSLDKIRVGLVRFSSNVDVIANLQQSTSTKTTIDIISEMAYERGGTNTYTALQVTREDVLTSEGGDRPDVTDVVMVLTDGKSWSAKKTTTEAQKLRQKDVEIIALGIGKNVLMSELRAMSSGVVRVIDNFAALDDVVDEIRGIVCTVAENATEKLYSTHKSSPLSPSPTTTTTSTLPTTTPTTTSSTSPPTTTIETTTPPPPPTLPETTSLPVSSVSLSSAAAVAATDSYEDNGKVT